jgi:hypothetical protein
MSGGSVVASTLLLASLVVVVSPDLGLADEQGPSESAERLPSSDPGQQLPLRGAEARDAPREAFALTADRAIRSLIPPHSSVEMDVVRVTPGTRPTIYCRTKIGWIEFANKIPLDRPSGAQAALDAQSLASEIAPRLNAELLSRPILSKDEVDGILQRCNPALHAPDRRLRPPFFNNRTGIHWDASRDFLAVEANAVMSGEENQCVRGIVDPVPGPLPLAPSI